MKIAVAGGTGFLGNTIVRALSNHGHEVTIISRRQPSPGRRIPGMEWRHGDVTAPETLPAALTGNEAVVDAVQFPNSPIENPARGYTFEHVDYEGTCNLVDAATQAGCRLFVGISGVGADSSARYHWLRFKALEEEHIRSSSMAHIIFRPSWIYGPGDVSLNRFLGFARFLPFVPVIGDGQSRINPLFIDDLGAHIGAAVEREDVRGRTFEIGGPAVLTMNEIIRTALRVSGRRRFLLHQPPALVRIGAQLAQYLPGRPLTPGAVDFITLDGVADNRELTETFGLPLTPFEQGVRSYLVPDRRSQ